MGCGFGSLVFFVGLVGSRTVDWLFGGVGSGCGFF